MAGAVLLLLLLASLLGSLYDLLPLLRQLLLLPVIMIFTGGEKRDSGDRDKDRDMSAPSVLGWPLLTLVFFYFLLLLLLLLLLPLPILFRHYFL